MALSESDLAKAKRLKTRSGEREAHSLKDQIALQEHLDNQAGANKAALPLRIAKIRSGGTVPTSP